MGDKMLTKIPKIILISGSSKFIDVVAVVAWLLEKEEHAITMGMHLLPPWYFGAGPQISDHVAEHEGVAEGMDELHLQKIAISDALFVVDCAGYIGSSTRKEIAFAAAQGIPIRYLSTEVEYQSRIEGLLAAYQQAQEDNMTGWVERKMEDVSMRKKQKETQSESRPGFVPGQPLESKRHGLCAFVRWDGESKAVIMLRGGLEYTVDWDTLTVL